MSNILELIQSRSLLLAHAAFYYDGAGSCAWGWDFGPWGGWVGVLVGTWGIKVACRNWIPNSGCHVCFGDVCVFFLLLFLLCFWCLSRHVATMTYLCCV